MEHYCQGERYFSVFYDVQTPSVGPTQFSVKCIFGFFFHGCEASGREIENSHSSRVKAKNEWSCTSIHLCLHVMGRDIFIFT